MSTRAELPRPHELVLRAHLPRYRKPRVAELFADARDTVAPRRFGSRAPVRVPCAL